MAEKTNQDIQDMIIRIEIGKKQLETLVQHSRMIEATLVELDSTLEFLEQLKKNKPGTEILVPIGGDSFVKASIKDSENVLTGVGAKVSVEKKVDDTMNTIKDRAKELGETLKKTRNSAVMINNEIENLNRTVQDLIQKSQAEK